MDNFVILKDNIARKMEWARFLWEAINFMMVDKN